MSPAAYFGHLEVKVGYKADSQAKVNPKIKVKVEEKSLDEGDSTDNNNKEDEAVVNVFINGNAKLIMLACNKWRLALCVCVSLLFICEPVVLSIYLSVYLSMHTHRHTQTHTHTQSNKTKKR